MGSARRAGEENEEPVAMLEKMAEERPAEEEELEPLSFRSLMIAVWVS
jgi:hypothetical protein